MVLHEKLLYSCQLLKRTCPDLEIRQLKKYEYGMLHSRTNIQNSKKHYLINGNSNVATTTKYIIRQSQYKIPTTDVAALYLTFGVV